MSVLLSSNRLLLRAPEPEDAIVMREFENDTQTWQPYNATGPYSLFELRRYLARTHNDLYTDRQLRLMMQDNDDQVVGIIDLFDFDPQNSRVELGIMVNERQRRMGYALEAIHLLENHCFHCLNIHQIYAKTEENNKPALALFAKAGFVKCGVLTDWICRGNQFSNAVLLQRIAD